MAFKERLMFARHQWEARHGNFLFQGSTLGGQDGTISDTEARKVFKFLDYNEARVVSKHQIRLLLVYHKHVHEEKSQNEAMRRLAKMLHVSELNVFDENLFAFFFSKKNPIKAM